MSLKKIIITIMLTMILIGFVSAEANITVNPVGTISAGEKFNITGITTIDKIKKIGIEIFPDKFWNDLVAYAKEDNAGKVRFKELPSSGDTVNPTEINMVRFNPDGTQAYQTVKVSENYAHIIVPVNKDSSGKMVFNAEINEKVKKIPFQKGKYHMNVYDASMEIERPGTIMPNGWDVIKKKAYPSTTFSNIWDPKNEKELEYVVFTIR
ncbi:hypothetical protein [Methanospirillum sp.]|uniref:hypothetical protein n=1 Tax=Methanospirillum sp. TaxID=45200 RepID=UPI002985FFFB|nr:hypothetical protein [Methanospirillum sp.]